MHVAQFGMFRWVIFCWNSKLYGYKRHFKPDLVNEHRSICPKLVRGSLNQVSHHSMGFWQQNICSQMANLRLRPKETIISKQTNANQVIMYILPSPCSPNITITIKNQRITSILNHL